MGSRFDGDVSPQDIIQDGPRSVGGVGIVALRLIDQVEIDDLQHSRLRRGVNREEANDRNDRNRNELFHDIRFPNCCFVICVCRTKLEQL